MKYDIFGKIEIEVIRVQDRWVVFQLSNEGKRRRLNDIDIPGHLAEPEIIGYIDDIYHEWATSVSHSVTKIE